MKKEFLTHINGLRAISVLFVIAYHLELGFDESHRIFAGGLIGVDIFFVISGYIITRQMILQGSKYNIFSFYVKRVRRILPALLMMLLISTICAEILLVGRARQEYFNSLLSVIGFSANIFFWMQDGYTAEANLYRPLLHMWSLGIEEQFYILYPFVWLYILKKTKYKKLILLIGMALSYGLMVANMDTHPSAAFYLIPTRAWQIMVGAYVALLYQKEYKQSLFGDIASTLALLIIFFSVFYFNDRMETRYDLLAMPVISAGVILYFNKSVVANILNVKILQTIGLISFSLYLYHQPVVVYKRIFFGDDFQLSTMVIVIFTIFLLSAVSYKYVENKFRQEEVLFFSVIKFIGGLLFILISCYIFNLFNYKHDLDANFKIGEYQEVALKKDGRPCHDRNIEDLCELKASNETQKKIYVVGDSHASVIGVKIAEVSKLKGYDYIQMTAPGCHYAPFVKTKYCTQFNKLSRKKLLSISPQTIVITGRLPLYISGLGYNNGEGGAERRVDDNFMINKLTHDNISIAELLKNLSYGIQELVDYGHRVVLIYPVPEPGWNIASKLVAMSLKNDIKSKEISFLSHSYEGYAERTKDSFKVYDDVRGKVDRIYPAKILCNAEIVGRCITHSPDLVYYRDDNHLSTFGSDLLLNEISKIIF